MGVLGDLVVRIVGDTTNLNKSIDKSKGQLTDFSKVAEQVGKKMAAVGKKMTAFVTLPILGLGAAFVKTASDAEETNSKFDAVFKDQAASVRKWAEEFSKATGRARIDNIAFLSTIQDTLVPLGVARDEAADLSQEVVKLATDLASFNNLPTEQVIRDIQSALVGQTETVRKYGVVLTEAGLKQRGIGDDATAAEKALERLKIITESTADAQGDAIRTADSMANQFVRLKSSLTDLATGLGTLLIPIVKDIVGKITEWVNKFNALDDGAKKTILTIAGLVAAAGPLLIIIGKITIAIGTLRTTISGPLTLAFAAIGVMITAFTLALKEAKKEINGNVEGLAKYTMALADAKTMAKAMSKEEIAALYEKSKLMLKSIGVQDDTVTGIITLTESQKLYNEKLAEMGEEFRIVDEKAKLFGDEIDVVAEKNKILKDIIEDLLASGLGFTALSPAIQDFLNRLQTIGTVLSEDVFERIKQTNQDIADEEKRFYQERKDERLRFDAWCISQAQMAADAEKAIQQAKQNFIIGLNQALGSMVSGFYQQQIADAEEGSKKQKQLMREAAIAQKLFGIIQAIINTAIGVTVALATVPPPANLVVAAWTKALGAAQIAAILAQPIPKLAEGGIARRASSAIVGEAGPEAILPLDDATLGRLGNAIAGAAGDAPIHVSVMLGPDVLYDRISRASRNGQIIIDSKRGVR